MIKQDRIRDGLKEYLRPLVIYKDETLLDGIVWYIMNQLLHEEGCVIKVDEEEILRGIYVPVLEPIITVGEHSPRDTSE